MAMKAPEPTTATSLRCERAQARAPAGPDAGRAGWAAPAASCRSSAVPPTASALCPALSTVRTTSALGSASASCSTSSIALAKFSSAETTPGSISTERASGARAVRAVQPADTPHRMPVDALQLGAEPARLGLQVRRRDPCDAS